MILKFASPHIKTMLIILSGFVLLRGHNHPGGGFIAGLISSAGIIFDAIIQNSSKPIKSIFGNPMNLIAWGLGFIFIAATYGMIFHPNILTAMWIKIDTGLLGTIELGTPMLFDVGIYFIVNGALLLISFDIVEDIQWK
jgi:multicomponent Na+:H+ antiporter subunit B